MRTQVRVIRLAWHPTPVLCLSRLQSQRAHLQGCANVWVSKTARSRPRAQNRTRQGVGVKGASGYSRHRRAFALLAPHAGVRLPRVLSAQRLVARAQSGDKQLASTQPLVVNQPPEDLSARAESAAKAAQDVFKQLELVVQNTFNGQ